MLNKALAARSRSVTPEPDVDEELLDRELPSGRRLTLTLRSGSEELTIASASGEAELTIRFDADGPVVKLAAAKLEVETPDEIVMDCRRFDVRATESAKISSQGSAKLACEGEMHMSSVGDMRLKGKIIHIN